MALIKCSECGKVISNKAHTCPKCGKPRTSMSASIILSMAITLLLSLVIMFVASFSPMLAIGIVLFMLLLAVVMTIMFLAKRI